MLGNQKKSAHSKRLIAHIIYRLDVGGLENGLVNLINGMPDKKYRHAVICLTDYTSFRDRINKSDTEFFAIRKRLGIDPKAYYYLWRLLRHLKPAIVHTRNLPCVDLAVPAACAGVRHIVHGEHGLDLLELGRTRTKYKYAVLRRLIRPLISQYIAVSRDIEAWLLNEIRIPKQKITQIYNGVDLSRFCPADENNLSSLKPAFWSPDNIVVGTVGRMEPIKDHETLVRAFKKILETEPDLREILKLVIVGDGSQRHRINALLESAGVSEFAWITGARDDIASLLKGFDLFVLPSISEGVSNTILEAMATGLPVIATRVGGNPELVQDGRTGILVRPQDPSDMVQAIMTYIRNPNLLVAHGRRARKRAENEFDLGIMVDRYTHLYDTLLNP